jgi:hypothetical protein
MKYGIAGFPSGGSGAWTFCEIEPGDFISFLYGARAYNLYRVLERRAIKEAEHMPPWKPLTFTQSGRTYSFPFRLRLGGVRTFSEPIVRAEFSYVAENLLLRGGYRKTHFQADQTTLQSVSQMGTPFAGALEDLEMPDHEVFTPLFTRNPGLVNPPYVFRFQELILQTAIRHELRNETTLVKFLRNIGKTDAPADSLEVLSEKALPQGHIDLLLKQRTPLGSSLRIPLEVKMNRARSKDLAQLRDYVNELGECPVGALIAADFGKMPPFEPTSVKIALIRYSLRVDLRGMVTFDDVCRGLSLEPSTK